MKTEISVLYILDSLESTGSRSEKLAIIERYKNHAPMKLAFNYALDPYRNFFIRKIPEYTPGKNETMTLWEAMEALNPICERQITGNKAIQQLKDILESVSEDDGIVIERIIKRDMRCGVSDKTINKVFPGYIPSYPVFLASPYSSDAVNGFNFPAILQLKADGTRANGHVKDGKAFICSRAGRAIDLFGTLDDDLIAISTAYGEDIMVDGELVAYDTNGNLMPRKAGNGLVNKAIRGTISEKEAKQIRFQVWDIVTQEEFTKKSSIVKYSNRLRALNNAIKTSGVTKIQVLETEVVNNMEEVLAKFNYNVSIGLEGVMLKDMNIGWGDVRSKSVIKFKSEREADLKVVGFNPGTGKFEGLVGSIIFESGDGRVRVSVSGMSDVMRKQITDEIDDLIKNSTIGTVKYNERITKKDGGVDSLFLPRLVKMRPDKTVPDNSDVIE